MRRRGARMVFLLLIVTWGTSVLADGPAGGAPLPAGAFGVTKKKSKMDRSTSSSSGERKGSDDADKAESLDMSMSGSSSSSAEKKNDKYKPKSTEERHGWRKWHRKCTPCPEEMELKWRDPRINWVCGGYQRARRSFKSPCMMRYRNCQDGTMFVKIHSHRCLNDTPGEPRPHGEHFFYDYRVMLSVDSTGSESSSVSEEETQDSNSRIDTSKLPERRHHRHKGHRRNMSKAHRRSMKKLKVEKKAGNVTAANTTVAS